MNSKFDSTTVTVDSQDVTKAVVNVTRSFSDKVKLAITYTVLNDGQLSVKYDLEADKSVPDLLRLGMTMGVPSTLVNTTYYGKGPWENYTDRKRACEVNEYSLATDNMFHSYAMPQENGNRTGVRWITLSSNA